MGGPDVFIEAAQAAVEVVGTVVCCERVDDIVEGETRLGDAASDATSDGTEVGMTGDVGSKNIKTEDQVGEHAVTIRHAERCHDAAERKDRHGRVG